MRMEVGENMESNRHPLMDERREEWKKREREGRRSEMRREGNGSGRR